jgi:hypothetical protein
MHFKGFSGAIKALAPAYTMLLGASKNTFMPDNGKEGS